MIQWIGCPSSNFRKGRPFGLRPEAIVIHIMDGSFAAGEGLFRNPSTQKSAHYGISRDGEIHQYVDENDTAFHAGIVVNPAWSLLKQRVNPNFYTIGIEHEGRPDDVWPLAQLTASATLIGQIAARWDIPRDDSHVIRHHQIRASKTCPGNWLEIGELIKQVPTTPALAVTPSVASQPAIEGGTLSPSAPAVAVMPAIPLDHAISIATVATQNLAKKKVVLTIRNVNLRRAQPLTTAQVVCVIPAHTEVQISKFEAGERVNGNSYWYVDVQGNYLWAGATNAPDPTVMAA